MAPVLGVAFSAATNSPVFVASLLFAYGVGHCTVIVAAGSSTLLVQHYLEWAQPERPMVSPGLRRIGNRIWRVSDIYCALAPGFELAMKTSARHSRKNLHLFRA